MSCLIFKSSIDEQLFVPFYTLQSAVNKMAFDDGENEEPNTQADASTEQQ